MTGDIATTDEDGFIRLAGRANDMITSRGRRFGPFEIEHALSAHGAVADSAAVGIRDLERGGQFVRAFVVPRAGFAASEQLEAELRDFVESSLPEYAVPREIEFLDELPRTPSGNIRRAELRDWQVAGRPLWETTPAIEPEPLLPSPAPEPEPPSEPTGFVVQEYFPQAQSDPAQEPAWTLGPDPVAPLEPALEPAAPIEPEPVAYVEPEPEVGSVVPETLPVQQPQPPAFDALQEPPPVVALPPLPTNEPVPLEEPVAPGELMAPPDSEPVAYPEPEPVARVEPEPLPTGPELLQLADDETGGAALPGAEQAQPEQGPSEPEPKARLAPVTEPAIDEPGVPVPPAHEPGVPEPALSAALDAQPEPEPVVYEPPVDVLGPATFAPDPTADEEPLEPLPDYVVDPNAERAQPPEAAADADKPDLTGLGLRPVSFELNRTESDRAATPKRPRPETSPPTDKNDRRSRSTGEPGDELEEVDWMGGLSTRLSAYSLSQEDEERIAEDADDGPDEAD